MYNKLSWTNANGATAVTVNIYRGLAALDRTALSGAIVSLTNGEVTYNDVNVLRGVTYYYVFETISATDRTVSQNYAITATPRRGGGSQVLLKGDYNYGYFGSIPSSSFITIPALRAAVNFLTGTTLNVSPKWHKFARNGKIIFVPDTMAGAGVTWKNLYDAGLVFGSNDNGPYNAGANVNQNAQVTIGPDVYRVRLMRGFSDDYSVFTSTATVSEPAETFTCEWDDFIYPQSVFVPGVQRMANVTNATIAYMLLTANAAGGVAMQEKTTSGASSTILTRGSTSATRTGVSNRAGAVSYSTAGPWWPVLELIEPAAV